MTEAGKGADDAAVEIIEFIETIPPMVAIGLLALGLVIGIGAMIVLSEDFRNARNRPASDR